MKVVILDDELYCVEVLQLMIEKYCPQWEIVRLFTKPEEALVYLKQSPPDILFLDIEMPGLNGFELLSELRPAPFNVVFTTAYDRYAIKAFKFSAIDYLLKPILKQDLLDLMERLKHTAPLSSAQYDMLLEPNADNAPIIPERIALSTAEGLQIVAVADIIHCESEGSYTHIHLNSKNKIMLSKSLGEASEVLDAPFFMRVHHSHLINLNYVERYIRGEGGEIVLRNGTRVPLARSKKQDFLNIFSKI